MPPKNKEKLTKTTVILPQSLLREAQAVSNKNITATIRMALEFLASKKHYERMLELEGTYKSTLDLAKLRED